MVGMSVVPERENLSLSVKSLITECWFFTLGLLMFSWTLVSVLRRHPLSSFLFLSLLLCSMKPSLEGHWSLPVIPVWTDMVDENILTPQITAVIVILPSAFFLQMEWSRHLVDRSDTDIFWLCTFWWINTKKKKKMWCFLSLFSELFPRKLFICPEENFGGGFGERHRTFVIWIKLNLFSRKTCWLWNWILLCVKLLSVIFRAEQVSDYSILKPGDLQVLLLQHLYCGRRVGGVEELRKRISLPWLGADKKVAVANTVSRSFFFFFHFMFYSLPTCLCSS